MSQGWEPKTIAKGLDLAISFKPDVINISSGTFNDDEELRSQVMRALKEGVIIVASAGNDNMESCQFPAAYPGVLSVGAIDKNLSILETSNYGASVMVYAPGEDILTTVTPYNPSMLTARFFGTSAATPFVTCLAAALKTRNPAASPEIIVNKIIITSRLVKSRGSFIRVIDYNKALNN